MDTFAVDTNSLSPAPELLRIYKVLSEGKLTPEYYSTEYLFHGMLSTEGCSRKVSLEALRGDGLCDLLPEFDDEAFNYSYGLCNTIATAPSLILGKDGALALWIASSFDGAWAMPVLVALLPQRLCDADDERFLQVLREFASKSLDSLVMEQT